jgi:hypothetical protein
MLRFDFKDIGKYVFQTCDKAKAAQKAFHQGVAEQELQSAT